MALIKHEDGSVSSNAVVVRESNYKKPYSSDTIVRIQELLDSGRDITWVGSNPPQFRSVNVSLWKGNPSTDDVYFITSKNRVVEISSSEPAMTERIKDTRRKIDDLSIGAEIIVVGYPHPFGKTYRIKDDRGSSILEVRDPNGLLGEIYEQAMSVHIQKVMFGFCVIGVYEVGEVLNYPLGPYAEDDPSRQARHWRAVQTDLGEVKTMLCEINRKLDMVGKDA